MRSISKPVYTETVTRRDKEEAFTSEDLEEKDLLRQNLKKLTDRTQEDGIQIKRVGGIKGWLSPAYKRMDAAPVMEAYLK